MRLIHRAGLATPVIIHTVGGICVSSRGEIIRLSFHNFLLIFLIAAKVDVMIQW